MQLGPVLFKGQLYTLKKLLKGLHYMSIHYSVHKRTIKIVHLELSLNTIIEQYRLSKTSLKRYLNILLNKTKLWINTIIFIFKS